MSSPNEAKKNHDIDDTGGEATAQSVWGRSKRLHDKARNLFQHDPTVTVVVMTITKGRKKAKTTILGPVRASQTKQTVEKAGSMILKVLDSKDDIVIERNHDVNTSAFEPVEIPFSTADRERKRKAPGRAAAKDDSAQPSATHLGNQRAKPPATQPPQAQPLANQLPPTQPPSAQPLANQLPPPQPPSAQPLANQLPATQPPPAHPLANQLPPTQPPSAQRQANQPPATHTQPLAGNQPNIEPPPSLALSRLLQVGLAILQAPDKNEIYANEVSIKIDNLIKKKKEDISPALLEEAERVKKGLDEVEWL